MTKRTPAFAKETDLCAGFISALPAGWTPYAETAGWDILLVRDSDGFQIGIQAKLKLNLDVINQTIESGRDYEIASPQPDCRAVMIPAGEDGKLVGICGYLGITVITVSRNDPSWGRQAGHCRFRPNLPDDSGAFSYSATREWFENCPMKRHPLPQYVPDVTAGASGPIQLTQWKICALKIAATIDIRGSVSRADFKHHKIDHRRWVAGLWLKPENGVFVRGDHWPAFEEQHPRVYEQIKAESADWLPPQDTAQGVLA